MDKISAETIARGLEATEPQPVSERLAGVSVILTEKRGPPAVLLIKRSEREGDPWSGQVAFPGGKKDRNDGSVVDTAIRETMEEVGIDLIRDARLLGFFGSFRTHTGKMVVVPAVFVMKNRARIETNQEVSSYRWVSLDRLRAPESRTTYDAPVGGLRRE
ncbi:MAG: CoA pyrophosphatase, partial [Nitrososphaerota archaeon]|nr:CoA pyrophosphatase [Nitrososphaerota archaeon]